MAPYLTSVLKGDIDIAQVKHWISEGNGLPPAGSVATSPRSPTSSDQPQLTADRFKVFLLNHVKEEADNIFLAAEQQATSSHTHLTVCDNLWRDSKPCYATAHPSRTPGLVNESSFPSLSIVPTKVGTNAFCNYAPPSSACDHKITALHKCVQKEALDRRLSLRQRSGSAAAFTSAAATQNKRGRKIAPTLVQLETNANSFPTLSSQAFATPQPQLLAEASAKDLCTTSHVPGELRCHAICMLPASVQVLINACCMTYPQAAPRQPHTSLMVKFNAGGDMQGLDSQAIAAPSCDASSAPAAAAAAAWHRLHTPSSAGSTTTRGAPAKQSAYVDTTAYSQRGLASPTTSHLSTHSAPALTPAKSRGKPKRISPSPLGEASSVGQLSALPSSRTSAWTSPTANASPSPSPTISTSANSAWHKRSSSQSVASSAGQSRMSESHGAAAAQAKGCQPARGAAWGQPAHTPFSAVTPNRSAWSTPGPQSYHSSRQNSGPQTPWGAQSAASPDSTATSKLEPTRQEPVTPLSQVKSESGSTGTEYVTPPSTLRPWRDSGADSSPSSPEGRVSSPKGQRLSSRFTAASEVTPGGADTPLRTASDSGRHCSLAASTSQGLSQPIACGPDANGATSAAQLDLLAAEHPEQMEHEQPQAAAPVLDDETVCLAELHAHIVAGKSCQSSLPSMLARLHVLALFVSNERQASLALLPWQELHSMLVVAGMLQVLSDSAHSLLSPCTTGPVSGKNLPSKALCIGGYMLYADVSLWLSCRGVQRISGS